MNVIIYSPNSHGGNYDYSLQLTKAYGKRSEVSTIDLVLPQNAKAEADAINRKVLVKDVPPKSGKTFSRLYFLWRTFLNPLRFYFLLLKRKSGYVIFNDYDQASSFLWVPLFKTLGKRFVFAVILHDPDRDHYFHVQWLSTWTMKRVMSLMDVAFFHDILPQRIYYQNSDTRYICVPHGLYDTVINAQRDDLICERLKTFKGRDLLIGAIGNIRHEKNYEIIIEALSVTAGVKLLISGIPANTSVNVEMLRKKVEKSGISDRVLIFEKYASTDELKAMGEQCDAFILYYSQTFKSQSGILNMFAPFQKPLLVSDNESPLASTVKKFNLGISAVPDSKEALVKMLESFKAVRPVNSNWAEYFAYASWDNHVEISLKALQQVRSVA